MTAVSGPPARKSSGLIPTDEFARTPGKSYGGKLSAWSIGHADLYKAAVVMAPVGNIETHYGTFDGGYYADPFYIDTQPVFDREVARSCLRCDTWRSPGPPRCSCRARTTSAVLARHLHEHHVTRLTLDQRRDLAVVIAEHQVAFPMPWYCSVLNAGGSLADRDGIDDLAVNRRPTTRPVERSSAMERRRLAAVRSIPAARGGSPGSRCRPTAVSRDSEQLARNLTVRVAEDVMHRLPTQLAGRIGVPP